MRGQTRGRARGRSRDRDAIVTAAPALGFADPARRAPLALRVLRRLSAETLLLGVMLVSVASAALLTVAILGSVARTNAAAMERIGTALLARLEEGGLGAVALAVEQVETTLAPARDRFEVAVWRRQGEGGQGEGKQGGDWRLLRESEPGAAARLGDLAPGSRRTAAGYAAAAPDVAAASRDWEIPVADVRIAYAMALPTAATREARRTLGAIWAGYGLALATGLILHLNHRARYRAGLAHVSDVLAAFSDGETGARVTPGLPAPELVRLGEQVNAVLPRIEELMAGLRYVSAHLAHEIRTPLQAIRGDAGRLARAADPAERARIEARIDRTIDQADARLQSVMRLFRLQSGERTEMQEGVDLGALVEEQVFDLEDMLERDGRTLAVAIAPGVRIRCNPPLMETLVINLLSNAAKYAPPGARIEVALEASPATTRPVKGAEPGDMAGAGRFRLRVGNSGSRFPEALRRTAFARFARDIRHEAAGAAPGFGLGLSTVAGIAARHGFRAEITETAEGEERAEIVVSGPCAPARPEVQP